MTIAVDMGRKATRTTTRPDVSSGLIWVETALLRLSAEIPVDNVINVATRYISDFAVGAPYEGQGAVYIYHGSKDGVKTPFSQVTYLRTDILIYIHCCLNVVSNS